MDPTKLEHFRNLISLSAADGKIMEIERITLSKIAYERGIPMDRLNVMFAKAHEYQYVIPQNHLDREQQLHEMIDLALVDGEFSKPEHDLITMVAEKLGFSKTELYSLIERHKAANGSPE